MKEKQREYCKRIICRYKKLPHGQRKNKARNKLFDEMKPYMEEWMRNILSKKKVYLEPEEFTAKMWDCFEYCLMHYKPNKPISVPNHFYNYSRFYLDAGMYLYDKETTFNLNTTKASKKQLKAGKQEVHDDDFLRHDVEKIASPAQSIYENIDELRSFRGILGDEYVLIFDDALMSMTGRNVDKQNRIGQTTVTQLRYKESKKIFKVVIDYLLRR